MAPRRCISPKWLMPSSMTAASVSGPMRKMVSGTPSSLLKFFSVRRVLNLRARTQATISLVVVLPELPVMPTTGTFTASRQRAASLAMAWATSGTVTTGPETPSGTLCARQQGAPASSAAAMNSCPSRLAPGRAQNISPGATSRLSRTAPVTARSAPPPWSVPPVYSATFATVMSIMRTSPSRRLLSSGRARRRRCRARRPPGARGWWASCRGGCLSRGTRSSPPRRV